MTLKKSQALPRLARPTLRRSGWPSSYVLRQIGALLACGSAAAPASAQTAKTARTTTSSPLAFLVPDAGFINDTNLSFCPDYDSLFTPEAKPINNVCTTTTTVTTTTTASTVTTTSTTSAFIQQRCEELCGTNTHPWFVKCVWEICATCLQCTNVIKPPPPTPPPPPPRTFPSTTTITTSSTSSTSTTSTSSTTTTTNLPPTSTTVTTEQTLFCQAGCYRAVSTGENWGLLCQWALCWGCKECDPTTTTVSSTSTSTTTTETMTTLTSTCDPLNCGFNFATTTANITTTTTSASTTTTTTTNGACAPLSTVYPVRGCQDAMSPNTTCETHTVEHPCVEQSKMIFSCPADNTDPERQPDLIFGTYRSKCKVCALETTEFLDIDPRRRRVNMSFEFGPNSLEGIVDETGIEAYQIWFADMCGNLLAIDTDNKSHTGEIASVPVYGTLEAGCCTPGAYKVGPLSTRMPGDDPNLTVVVIPKIRGIGLLNVGSIAGLMTDFHDREAEAFYGIPRASGAVRRSSGTSLLVTCLLFCSFAWLLVGWSEFRIAPVVVAREWRYGA